MVHTGIPNINCSLPLVINLIKINKPTQITATKNCLMLFYSLASEHSSIHFWHCPPDMATRWLCLTLTPLSVTFLLQNKKVLIDCSKSQVAQVLFRSKHWDLDPKYLIFDDVVGFGFKSLAFLPISNVIQNWVHFLICCSHSHLWEAEYRGDCKK